MPPRWRRSKCTGFADTVNDRRQHGQGLTETHLVGEDAAHGLDVWLGLPLAEHGVQIAGRVVSERASAFRLVILQGAASSCLSLP